MLPGNESYVWKLEDECRRFLAVLFGLCVFGGLLCTGKLTLRGVEEPATSVAGELLSFEERLLSFEWLPDKGVSRGSSPSPSVTYHSEEEAIVCLWGVGSTGCLRADRNEEDRHYLSELAAAVCTH